MTHAFAALSVKRNRSTSTSKTNGLAAEPGKKFSKLISKITNSIIVVRHDSKRLNNNRPSVAGLFHYFKSENNIDTLARNPCLRGGHAFACDDLYEHNHYKKAAPSQIKLDLKQHHQPRTEVNSENIGTTDSNPDADKQSLPSILVKSAPRASAQSYLQPQRNTTSHIRQHSHVSHLSSSNVTTHSEDLTAKEFADIAGIKILPDDEEGVICTVSTRSSHDYERDHTTTSHHDHDDDYFHDRIDVNGDEEEGDRENNKEEHILSSHSTYSSMHSQDCRKPCIWDSEFWQNPDSLSGIACKAHHDDLPKQISASSFLEPPILHELRRMSTKSSEGLSNHDAHLSRPCVIKKGRFEIHLETHTPDPIPTSQAILLRLNHQPSIEGKSKEKSRNDLPRTIQSQMSIP